MNEPRHETMLTHELQQVKKFGSHHRFMLMITGVILMALMLVAIALALYNSSGAALLDLSQPGYQAARDQIANPSDDMEFPATGPINDETLSQFRNLYDKQAHQATGVNSFNPDALSDKALGLDESASDTNQSDSF